MCPGVPSAHAQETGRPATRAVEAQLTQLARSLRESDEPADHTRLADFARRHAASEPGARAALALAYSDFSKGRQPQARKWLDAATRSASALPDWPLREYLLYWSAQVDRALGKQAAALAELDEFRRNDPDSVMADQALQALGELALALGQPERGVAALEKYSRIGSKPALLLLWARALEQQAGDPQGKRAAAAALYREIYFRFPLSDEAQTAGTKLGEAERNPGDARQLDRAAAFYEARRWRDARAEYERLRTVLEARPPSDALELVKLRQAECHAQLTGALAPLAGLALSVPARDAERLYRLSQFQRSKKLEAEMLATTEQLAKLYPDSPWAEEALFAAGNYFWVNLDRERAASYYRRISEQFPSGKNARNAHWRAAWTAYVTRKPEAASLMEEHLRRFPGSPYTQDALYWLGRAAERSGSTPHARSFYLKAVERYPQTYFGRRAADRLRPEPAGIGSAPVNNAEFLALIPAPPPLPHLEEPVPPGAEGRWARAQALRTIAFDASAELELRTAYAETSVPRLLWEAARAALDAGHYPVAVVLTRQIYPQLDARRIEDIPEEVWRTLYPLPHEASLKRAAARQNLDPMLVAALIRQETIFQADAVSHAGAVGLMQVLPKTGAKLARRLKIRYARAKLFDPEYNLRLGTLYLADLLGSMGSPEKALAAYNAGEDRVAAWESERSYDELAEFVESIPFTETRDYVQIVMRNAELYRLLYGGRR